MGHIVHTRGSCAGLKQKLSKLNLQHETLSKENAALRAELKNWEKDIKAFKAIEDAYQKTFDEAKAYKELYHDARSKSRVNELAMVVCDRSKGSQRCWRERGSIEGRESEVEDTI